MIRLPAAIRRQLGKFRAVFRRLRIWQRVSRGLAPESESDAVSLIGAIRRSPLTVWRNLDQWQFPMVPDDCSVVSKGIGAFHVRGQTDDLFHVVPMQEPAVEKAIRSILKLGDTFVDAGANIGFYTVLASKLVGDQGQVVAFEMIPDTARILRLHVDKNECRNAMVVEGALAETSGLKVEATLVDRKSGQASIASGKGNVKLEVTTITLADELEHVPQVDLMKMDLEGAEFGALRGLGSDLQKVRAIIFENRGARDVIDYLEACGFDVTRLDGSNALAYRAR